MKDNSRRGGRGSYRTWTRNIPFGSNLARLIWCFERGGYQGLAPIMHNFHHITRHTNVYQKAVFLLCMIWPLAWLKAEESKASAAWFSSLLEDHSPEVRVCGVLALQRLASQRPV